MRAVRFNWLWIISVMLIVIASVARALQLTQQSLLERATRITTLRSGKEGLWSYRWITQNRLVACQEHPDAGRRFFLYDSTKGAFCPMTVLNGTPAGESTDGGPSVGSFSPDGRFLLWSRYPEEEHYTAITETAGGLDYREWPSGGIVPIWLADSRHWIEFGSNGRSNWIWTYDVYRPDVKPRKIPLATSEITLAYNSDIGHINRAFYVINMTAIGKNRLVTDDWAWWVNSPITSLRVLELQIGEKVAPVHHYIIHFPSGRMLSCRTIYRQGDRIAWRFLLPSDPEKVEFWTSRINGTNWQKIGDLEETGSANSNDEERFSLQWLPDGERLSFIYKSTLYTVPAD